jgi:hypothetical protein
MRRAHPLRVRLSSVRWRKPQTEIGRPVWALSAIAWTFINYDVKRAIGMARAFDSSQRFSAPLRGAPRELKRIVS